MKISAWCGIKIDRGVNFCSSTVPFESSKNLQNESQWDSSADTSTACFSFNRVKKGYVHRLKKFSLNWGVWTSWIYYWTLRIEQKLHDKGYALWYCVGIQLTMITVIFCNVKKIYFHLALLFLTKIFYWWENVTTVQRCFQHILKILNGG